MVRKTASLTSLRKERSSVAKELRRLDAEIVRASKQRAKKPKRSRKTIDRKIRNARARAGRRRSNLKRLVGIIKRRTRRKKRAETSGKGHTLKNKQKQPIGGNWEATFNGDNDAANYASASRFLARFGSKAARLEQRLIYSCFAWVRRTKSFPYKPGSKRGSISLLTGELRKHRVKTFIISVFFQLLNIDTVTRRQIVERGLSPNHLNVWLKAAGIEKPLKASVTVKYEFVSPINL